MVGELPAAESGLVQGQLLDHRPHGAVEDEDPPACGFRKTLGVGGVNGLHSASLRKGAGWDEVVGWDKRQRSPTNERG